MSKGISRKNAEFFNTKIKGKALENVQANQIRSTNINDLNEVKIKLLDILSISEKLEIIIGTKTCIRRAKCSQKKREERLKT